MDCVSVIVHTLEMYASVTLLQPAFKLWAVNVQEKPEVRVVSVEFVNVMKDTLGRLANAVTLAATVMAEESVPTVLPVAPAPVSVNAPVLVTTVSAQQISVLIRWMNLNVFVLEMENATLALLKKAVHVT